MGELNGEGNEKEGQEEMGQRQLTIRDIREVMGKPTRVKAP